MNERRSKKKKKKKDGEPATEENRSERQTFIRGGGAVSPCRRAVFAACLSPLYLEHQPHQQEDKTKQKKKKTKLYPPFPVQNQTCSRGTWKEAKMWHSHPYRISRFIIFSLFFSLSWLSWQPPNRLLFSISSSGGARTRWVREVERHVTVSNTL